MYRLLIEWYKVTKCDLGGTVYSPCFCLGVFSAAMTGGGATTVGGGATTAGGGATTAGGGSTTTGGGVGSG